MKLRNLLALGLLSVIASCSSRAQTVVIKKPLKVKAVCVFVKDSAGRALSGAELEVRTFKPAHGEMVKSVATDDRGFADLSDLSRGEYSIHTRKDGERALTWVKVAGSSTCDRYVVVQTENSRVSEIGSSKLVKAKDAAQN